MSSGKPFERILTYAKDHEIDLICMGASGAGPIFGRLLGSNVDRVLRHAPCPVFIARSFNAGFDQSVIRASDARSFQDNAQQGSYQS